MNVGTILFAGGGTGGHIFPALAIAQACIAQACVAQAASTSTPNLRCEFVVSQRPLDASILSQQSLAGAPVVFHAIPAQPAVATPKGLYRFISCWGLAVRTARAIIARAKAHGPVAIVSTGGFVSAPVAQAARAERVPLVMVNLDAVPGKANRWIGKHATTRVTALAVAPHVQLPSRQQWQSVRPIVREALLVPHESSLARAHFGLAQSTRTLLITGGSQGAGSMNALLPHALASTSSSLREALSGWQVLHQCGAQADAAAIRSAYTSAGVAAHVTPFIDRMDLAWRATDLALCRAGAGNVAEVWATSTPAIFLPYPYHRDQHQLWNARPLQDAGAAHVVSDEIEPGRTLVTLGPLLSKLLQDDHARAGMRAALNGLGPADGASTIASLALAQLAAAGKTV